MSPAWRQDKTNHHFPELNKKRRVIRALLAAFTWSRLNFLLIALAVFLGGVYLWQANFVATKGYAIKDAENKVATLKEENKKLNFQYIQLQSIAALTGKIQDLRLVPAEKMEIINAANMAVALRQ